MRRVLLGTPCLDGKPEAWYMNSVVQTIKFCLPHGIDIIPILMSYDAMIQRARNDLVKLALEQRFDDLLFIDDDEEWEPAQALALLNHPVNVVGAAVRKKSDEFESYNVKASSFHIPLDPKTGLWIVDAVGTGFIRLSRNALEALWDRSEQYRDNGKVCRMVFNIEVVDGDLMGEDIAMCAKLKDAGLTVYLDPTFTVTHIGMKKYKGDFAAWIDKLKQAEALAT